MTLATTTTKVNYTANGVLTNFSFTFKTLDASHLIPYLDDVKQTTGFTVNLNADQDVSPGGSVDFDTAPADLVAVTLAREVPLTQETDYTPYDAFPAETHERALDLLTMQTQQNQEEIARSLKAPVSDDGSIDYTMPIAEALKFMQWNDAGTALILINIDQLGAVAISDFGRILVADVDADAARTTMEVPAVADSPVNGNLAKHDADGNLVDSGYLAEQVLDNQGNGLYNGLCLVNQKDVVLDAAAVSATDDEYPIDMHKTTLAGVTGTHQLLSTSQPTGVNGYSLKYAATSTASGQIGSRQIIEGYPSYDGKTITYSRYVKSNSTDARLIVDDGATVTATAHTGGGTWELLSITVAIGSSPSELTCYLVIASATLTNVSITSGDYIEFTSARLDKGSFRLSGDREPHIELALCEWYYRRINAETAFAAFTDGFASSTTTVMGVLTFTPMRAAPTVSSSGGFRAAGVSNLSASLAFDQSYTKGVRILATVAGATAGYGYLLQANNDANAYIELTAEL